MARLKNLISNQDIAFDTHQAGDGQPVNVDALHLEKRLYGGGKIRFPLFGNRNPSSEGVDDRRLRRVTREVRSALSDTTTTEQLAETLVSQLRRFKGKKMTIDDAREAANNLAKFFNLGPAIVERAVFHAESQLQVYQSIHLGPQKGKAIEIAQSSEEVAFQRAPRTWI
jgi:hypothetical protein